MQLRALQYPRCPLSSSAEFHHFLEIMGGTYNSKISSSPPSPRARPKAPAEWNQHQVGRPGALHLQEHAGGPRPVHVHVHPPGELPNRDSVGRRRQGAGMRHHASPKATTVLRFATRTSPIPVTVDTFETRRRHASPKVTTLLRFATKTPPILDTVDTFETRRCHASPKATTVLRFATRTSRIPDKTVNTWDAKTPCESKSDDSSAFRDNFRPRMPASTRGRLRTGERLLHGFSEGQRCRNASWMFPFFKGFRTFHNLLLGSIRTLRIYVDTHVED